jgi:hypothetical protein
LRKAARVGQKEKASLRDRIHYADIQQGATTLQLLKKAMNYSLQRLRGGVAF